MKRKSLTDLERRVIHGLVSYPDLDEKDIISILDIKPSSFYSIRKRLLGQGLIKYLYIPMINRIGGEILAVIHTNFNPVIPLENRIEATKKSIEISEEIFLSIGEQDKGFSLSFSRDYTNIGRINDVRTEIFGKLMLLEKEYPLEVIFPFEISKIERFFEYSCILSKFFNIDFDGRKNKWFENNRENVEMNEKEKRVFVGLVENPTMPLTRLCKEISVSMNTVARLKREFVEEGLLKKVVIPDLGKMGFEILAFYHIKYNPNKPPSEHDFKKLEDDSIIFFANRKFESVIISAHPTYQDYKERKMEKIKYLKERNLITFDPLIRKYMFNKMRIIKDFDFSSITRKLLYT